MTSALTSDPSSQLADPNSLRAGRPLVSVVLPVWNGERFLAEAIESVTSQTLVALELLIVDDGSTDRTSEIASEAARKDPRVIVIDRPHGGIAEALNAGIGMAR
ncbi:MAG: glycosyltransferase family 2 protein, partial [Thermoanaerobaculia bacterium]